MIWRWEVPVVWRPWRSRKARTSSEPEPPATPETAPAPAAVVEGWWFAPAGPAPRAGTAHEEDVVPAPRVRGLHAARTVLDALHHARSPHLCRVTLSGHVVSTGVLAREGRGRERALRARTEAPGAGEPILYAATARTIRFCFDPTSLLRSIAVEIARGALADATWSAPARALADRIAERPVPAPELGALRDAADRARDAMIDAEDRMRDAQWRIEQLPPHAAAARRDAVLEDAERARRDAARHRAHAHAIDALVIAAGRTPAELGAAIDGALRAAAWRCVATRAEAERDAITSAALDAAIDALRGAWALDLDRRVLAIAEALGLDAAPADPTESEPPPALALPPPNEPPPDEPPPDEQARAGPPAPTWVAEAVPLIARGFGPPIDPLDVALTRPSHAWVWGDGTLGPRPLSPGKVGDGMSAWERAVYDRLRTLPHARRAAWIPPDESDPLACPVVLVLVLPFRHWPAVLEAVREIRDDLGDRTQCLLVGDEDLGRAFEGGLYISSEAVTIDWGLLPLQRGDSLGDLWAETFWAAPLDPGPDD